LITQNLSIPTIGIGAGPDCDGQVLVINNLLGLTDFNPKLAKQYVNLKDIMSQAISAYRDEVKGGQFPTKENSFIIDTAVLEQVKAKIQ